MRQWNPSETAQRHAGIGVLCDAIESLGQPGFAATLLARLRGVLEATSLSVYRTGPGCVPRRYMGASHLVPDTTRDCWRAYMSGPWLRDRTLMQGGSASHDGLVVCHVTAAEVPREHRAKVYEAHALAERASVVRRQHDGSFLALNIYRHADHRPFGDAQLADFAELAPAVLALARKHLALLGAIGDGPPRNDPAHPRRSLQALHAGLTPRELDVCERILRGLTDDGIAADLGLGLPTVRTYRGRAFARLGIHYRGQLFALVHGGSAGAGTQRRESGA